MSRRLKVGLRFTVNVRFSLVYSEYAHSFMHLPSRRKTTLVIRRGFVVVVFLLQNISYWYGMFLSLVTVTGLKMGVTHVVYIDYFIYTYSGVLLDVPGSPP